MVEIIDLTGDDSSIDLGPSASAPTGTAADRRQTRSSTRAQQASSVLLDAPTQLRSEVALRPSASTTTTTSRPSSAPFPFRLLPPDLGPCKARMSRADFRLLLKKRDWLRTNNVPLPADVANRLQRSSGSNSSSKRKKQPSPSTSSAAAANPVAAALVFAQPEAGSAVCISPSGVVLTCAHCVAESAAELDREALHSLVFASGAVVSARVVAWGERRDLALLLIVEAEPLPTTPTAAGTATGAPGAGAIAGGPSAPSPPIRESGSSSRDQRPSFPYIPVAAAPPKPGARLLCAGQPGAEDLETGSPDGSGGAPTPTGYDTLFLSAGAFGGLAPGHADPQDNSEIGALVHSCWTYWGHSGAALSLRSSGVLVGVHSSWDDETGDRRGVPWEAIVGFLDEFEGGKGRDMLARRGGFTTSWQWYVREGREAS